jgi:uncharacterized membrane protein
MSIHAAMRSGGCAGQAGQGLVLGVLFLGLVLMLMLVVPGLAIGYAERAGVQSAADAAALACAAQATVTQYVDARGNVYGTTVAVDPSAGPLSAAAAWVANLRWWPVRTLAFAATPSGADCTVAAEIEATIPSLRLLGSGRESYQWAVSAHARAYAAAP